MILYIILAEICLTIGAPNWAVTLCWIGVGSRAISGIVELIQEGAKKEAKTDKEIKKALDKIMTE